MRQLVSYGLRSIIISIAVVAGGFAVLHAQPANEPKTSGLTVSPTSVDVKVPPGGSYSGQMQVLNQSDTESTYRIYATPYSVRGEEYTPHFTPIKDAIDISEWFTFKNKGDSIKVGEQDTVPYTINVPENVGAGSYFATIFAETKDKGTTGVITHKRVGMVVYLRVTGDVIEKGEVTGWNVDPYQQPPFSASVKLANSGSVHFKAKVSTSVSDLFGGKKFAYTKDVQILPQKQRNISTTWENGATFGLFKVNGEVQYLGKSEKLPEKLVFLASTEMLVTLACIIAVVFVTLIYIGKRRVAAHKK